MGTCTVAAGGKLTVTNPSDDWSGVESTEIVIKKVATDVIPLGTLVASETQVIGENGTRTFKFSEGMYRIKLSGVTNGLDVEWSEPRCPGAFNIVDGSYACTVPAGGTLTLRNPTVPYWIGDETVTFKITKTK